MRIFYPPNTAVFRKLQQFHFSGKYRKKREYPFLFCTKQHKTGLFAVFRTKHHPEWLYGISMRVARDFSATYLTIIIPHSCLRLYHFLHFSHFVFPFSQLSRLYCGMRYKEPIFRILKGFSSIVPITEILYPDVSDILYCMDSETSLKSLLKFSESTGFTR